MPHTNTVVTPVVALLEASKPIAFNINFARITGDTKAALLLSQLVYWTRRGADVLDNDGWVFKTREQWEEEIGLSKHEQVTARSILIQLGLMEEARTGAPARNCYRINPAVLGAKLAQLVRTEPVQWSLLDIRSDSQHMRTMLGRQFAFYRVLMQVTSTCTSAVYLSKALAIQRRFADRQTQQPASVPQQSAQLPWDTDWFRMAVDSTQADTGLSPAQQRDAKHKLCQIGVMHEAMMTRPRKQIYLRIDMQMLNKLLSDAVQKSTCQKQATGEEDGGERIFSKDSELLGAGGSPSIDSKTLPSLQSHDSVVSPRPFSDSRDVPEISTACQKRATGEEEGGERIFSKDSEPLTVSGSPSIDSKTLPSLQPHDSVVSPRTFSDSRDVPEISTACQNRTTRIADSDKLDVRFSQGSWPVLARPMSGFSTPSCPVLAGLHAHASCAGLDYKEDYIKTTTTTQPSSKVDGKPPKPDILQSKVEIEPDGPETGSVGLTGVAVVVVSSSMSSEESEDSWVWPEPFTKVEQEQGTRILNSLAKTGQLADAQSILDELAGWMATGGVKSNLSYLRKLVETHQSTPGGLVYERGPDVWLRRERFKTFAARAQINTSAVPPKGPITALGSKVEGEGAADAVVLTDAAKSGLAKAREMLAMYKKGSS